MYLKYFTATFNYMTPFKGFDYGELFSESDIKRAVVPFLEFPSLLQYVQCAFLVHEFQLGQVLMA
ncbi:hypothetical protein A9Q81_17130 [Gammaproteobacteria bacterium 42_54_T18]|nr:hypothetical protein A9Q81_17130 [Gammaproteobacteria bacterium 42_54_T18]